MKASLAIVALIFAQMVSARADDDKTSALTFEPYSSTYLPFNKGYLTDPHAAQSAAQNAAEVYGSVLDPRVFDVPVGETTASKFDAVRIGLFGKRQGDLALRLKLTMHLPGSQGWAGVCDRWSASSSTEALSRLVRETEGVVCGDKLISAGEMKELMSALNTTYDMYPEHGARNERYEKSSWLFEVRSALGIDDLNAHDFHQTIHDRLSRNEGVVIDADPGPAVWNHPVIKMESKSLDFNQPKDLDGIKELLTYLPSRGFEASSDEAREALGELSKLEAILSDAHRGTEKNFYKSMDPTSAEALRKTIYARGVLIREKLAPMFGSGQIRVRNDIRVKRVHSTVLMATETSDYADSKKLSSTKESVYDYFLFEKTPQDGGTPEMESSWVTPASWRPDIVWQPVPWGKRRKDAPIKSEYLGEFDPSERGLKDLVELGKRCLPVRRVVSFFGNLEAATSDNVVDAEEKKNLLAAYSEVKSAVNRKTLEEKIKGVAGISAEDFD